MELIEKSKLAKTALDKNSETFEVHIAALKALKTMIHLSWVAKMALLQADKTFIEISFEYLNYADIFSANLAMELPKHNGINDHAIKLVAGKQLLYRLIYNLRPVKLETLKTYIETYLKLGFIQPFKSFIGAFIFFDQKSNENLYLFVNYQGLNNLTIKNRYPLPLIRQSLDRLSWAKRFT